MNFEDCTEECCFGKKNSNKHTNYEQRSSKMEVFQVFGSFCAQSRFKEFNFKHTIIFLTIILYLKKGRVHNECIQSNKGRLS
jgi:hypothetical protein